MCVVPVYQPHLGGPPADVPTVQISAPNFEPEDRYGGGDVTDEEVDEDFLDLYWEGFGSILGDISSNACHFINPSHLFI